MRVVQKNLLGIFFLCIVFVCGFGNENIKIFWVTDTHIKAGDKVLDDRFLWFISQANAQKPDIVIHTGDAIDGKRGRENALAEIERFFAIWDGLSQDIASFFVPGNRDIGELYQTAEEDWLPYFPTAQKIADSFFNTTFDFSKNNTSVRLIILCEFSMNQNHETVEQWLTESLSEDRFDAIFIFSHSSTLYPIIRIILREKNWKHSPVYFLHGHEHGAQGMALQEEDIDTHLQRYLLGGLQDGYYGVADGFFRRVLPFAVQLPFYEEILVSSDGALEFHKIQQE